MDNRNNLYSSYLDQKCFRIFIKVTSDSPNYSCVFNKDCGGFPAVNMQYLSQSDLKLVELQCLAQRTLQQVQPACWHMCLNQTTHCQSHSDTVDATPQLLRNYFYISVSFWNDCRVDLLACPSLCINRSVVLLHLDVWKGKFWCNRISAF